MGSKTRSRNGCFTCRRRKKKCDESLYPDCKNCLANGLPCTWPGHVEELHKKIEVTEEEKRVSPSSPRANMVVPASSIGRPSNENFPSVITTEERNYISSGHKSPSPGRIVKPEKKGRNYFLERIAMQQDCVDENGDESMAKENTGGKTIDIKTRIAQQLDVDVGI